MTRNTRVRVVTPGGDRRPSSLFTIYAYPRFRMSLRNRSNRITGRITVKGARGVRFRGRRIIVYVVQPGTRRMRRLAASRISGPSGGSGRANVRFAALRRVGKRDFLYACIPGIHRAGQAPPPKSSVAADER